MGDELAAAMETCVCLRSCRVDQGWQELATVASELDTWEHEEEQAALQGHIGEVSSNLSLLQRPFRKVLAVDAWLAQYKHDTFRYSLVFDGPIGLNKFQFRMSFSPRSLEVTRSNFEDPLVRQLT